MTDYEKKRNETVLMVVRSAGKAIEARNERSIIKKMMDQAKKKTGPVQLELFGK